MALQSSDAPLSGGLPSTGLPSADSRVRESGELSGLQAIIEPSVDAATWRRALPVHVSQSLAQISTATGIDLRTEAMPSGVGEHVARFLSDLGVEDESVHAWLEEDVETLAKAFSTLLGTERIALRLEWVRSDACRKFHQDAIRARLICTYTGPGTEYGIAPRGEEPEDIRRVPVGSPMLLKGKAWRGSARPLLVHRSPPIEGTGQGRLVVVIDEALSQAA
ncbi:MAG: DUF1826 domain-containing protein [Pseudomonadota bacterium]